MYHILFQLIVLLFEVIAFGSGMQTLYQEQFKELLKNLFEVCTWKQTMSKCVIIFT